MISAALLGLLAGCGGGGDDADTGPPQRSVSESTTSTTAAPATIDLSQPIPGGSLHGAPRPPLENTGDDYVAIFESLTANLRWLNENPDTALLPELYVPGTEDHDTGLANFQFLVSNGYRWADEGYQLVSVDVVDTRPEAVSVRFVDSLEVERIVDTSGAQVGDARPRSPQSKNWNALLTPDGNGRWRIADVAPADGGTVQL